MAATYWSTFFGAVLTFAVELRFLDFAFFMRAMLQERGVQIHSGAQRADLRGRGIRCSFVA